MASPDRRTVKIVPVWYSYKFSRFLTFYYRFQLYKGQAKGVSPKARTGGTGLAHRATG